MTVKEKVFQASAIAMGFVRALGTDVGRKAFTEMVFPRGGGGTGNRLEPRTRLDYQGEVGDGTRSSIIMACYRWIARVFPEAPMLLVRIAPDGTTTPITTHRLLELLEEPNDFYSGITMWAAVELDLLLTGNAYILKVSSESGQPAELWWAPSTIIGPRWPRDGQTFISHYDYRPNGFPIRIEPEDVIHFRDGIDPENTRLGMSPLRSLFREVFTDLEASQWTATLLRNGAVPGLVISPAPVPAGGGEVPGSEEMTATKEYFQQEFTGDRRGRTLVMSGPTQVHQYGFNPEQMNVRGIRQIPEERITAVIGIPAAVVGLGTGLETTKVGATMKEMRELAYENVIIPLQRNISQTLEAQYLPDFLSQPKSHKLIWDLSQVRVLQADQKEEAELWGMLVEGSIATRAEAREIFNLENTDTDKVYLMQANIIEVPQGEAAPTPQTALPPAPPETRGDLTYERWKAGQYGPLVITGTHAGLITVKADARQRRIMARFREDAKDLEAQFIDHLDTVFDSLGQLVEDALLTVDLTQIVTRADTNNHYEWKQDPELEAIVKAIMDAMVIDVWQREALMPAFNDHYIRTLNATVGTVNVVMDLEVLIPDEKARAVIANGGRRAGLMDITGETRAAIFRALEEGRAAGQGPIALARKIREHVTEGRFRNAGVRYRSTLIARTETKFAQNVSSLATYLEADAVTGVLAFDNQAGFGDDDCTARDQTVFSFAAAEAETELEHPNGTLSWAPVGEGG